MMSMARPAFVARIVALLALLVGLAPLGCDEDVPAKSPASAAMGNTDLPWPLPLPSSSTEIPRDLIATPEAGNRLGVAADRLTRALLAAGYKDLRFYDIPEGFAVATPLELIDDQGLAMPHPDPAIRFSATYPSEGFFTMRFWSDLLSGKVGRFRLFVFVVIDHPFGYAIDVTDAQVLWKHPSAELPLNRSDLAYTANDHWYALVYEVTHPKGTDRVTLVEHPSDPMTHLTKAGILASLQKLAAEDSGKKPAPNVAPRAAVPASVGGRMPVFADRMKQVPFERGRARLESIRETLLSPTPTSGQLTALGFECATLRAEQRALATEADPIVIRFVADVEKTCGLDVPLAASYVELHAIEAKRLAHDSVKSECLGLKVALGDFGPQYVSNPVVSEVGGKFAAWCSPE
jgi:hypothetical protein